MKTVCRFEVNPYSWTRDHWSHKTTHEAVSTIFEEAKSYIGLSAKFNFRDWYGDVRPCNVRITNVELIDNYGNIIITEEADIEMPDHYIPCPWEIINSNFITKPDNWDTLSKEERIAFYAQFTFISPSSCSRS